MFGGNKMIEDMKLVERLLSEQLMKLPVMEEIAITGGRKLCVRRYTH
jgi:hypothetical protein